MKSRGLLWELWRKNRWGLAFSIAALLFCTGGALYARHLDRTAGRLKAEYEDLTEGTFRFAEILPRGLAGTNHSATIRIGRVGYSGPIGTNDTLSWSGTLANGFAPLFNVHLNELELAANEVLPPKMTIRIDEGPRRTISLARAVEVAERAGSVQVRLDGWRESGLTWSFVSLSLSLLILFAGLTLAEPHPARGFTGLPPRYFTLPIGTAGLVVWPLAVGGGLVLLLWLAWSVLVLPSFVVGPNQFPRWDTGLALAIGLSGTQGLVWGLPSFPKLRSWLIAAWLLAVLLGVGTLMNAQDALAGGTQSYASVFRVILIGLWLLTALLAWLGVGLERQGYWSAWRATPSSRKPMAETLQSRPFASPLRAQIWLEWRRNGRFALRLWGAAVLILTTADVLLPRVLPGKPWLADMPLLLSWFAGPLWLVVTGLNLARDPACGRLDLSTFTATRPVPVGLLLRAKLAAGAGLWLGALGLFAAGFAVAQELSTKSMGELDYFVFVVCAGIALHLFVGILPLCLTGRLPGLPWSALPLALIYTAAIQVARWFSGREQLLPPLTALLVTLVLLKLIVATWSFRRGLLSRLVTKGFVASYAGTWLILAWLVVLGGTGILFLKDYDRWPTYAALLVPCGLLLIPIARIALSPVALQMNRHR